MFEETKVMVWVESDKGEEEVPASNIVKEVLLEVDVDVEEDCDLLDIPSSRAIGVKSR